MFKKVFTVLSFAFVGMSASAAEVRNVSECESFLAFGVIPTANDVAFAPHARETAEAIYLAAQINRSILSDQPRIGNQDISPEVLYSIASPIQLYRVLTGKAHLPSIEAQEFRDVLFALMSQGPGMTEAEYRQWLVQAKRNSLIASRDRVTAGDLVEAMEDIHYAWLAQGRKTPWWYKTPDFHLFYRLTSVPRLKADAGTVLHGDSNRYKNLTNLHQVKTAITTDIASSKKNGVPLSIQVLEERARAQGYSSLSELLGGFLYWDVSIK